MSSLEEHEEHCLKTVGRPWTGVHLWLDQYFAQVPGEAHRVALHHRLGVESGVLEFGEEARPALELHIVDDLGVIPGTPEEVAGILAGQDVAALVDAMDILQSIIGGIWPGRSLPWEELAVLRLRGGR